MSFSHLYTGGPYKQRTGSAITAVSTDINGGAIKVPGTSDVVSNISPDGGAETFPTIKGGVGGASYADYGAYNTPSGRAIAEGAGSYVGMLKLTISGHSFTVGNAIAISGTQSGTYDGAYRIVAHVDANNVILNSAYKGNLTGFAYANPDGTIANQVAGNYAMKKLSCQVHGIDYDKLQSGAADYGRNKVARIFALRTSKIATAIRAGYWDMFSGRFTTDPSLSNDYTSMDFDGSNVPDDEAKVLTGHTYNVGGELTYRFGGANPTTDEYDTKNT